MNKCRRYLIFTFASTWSIQIIASIVGGDAFDFCLAVSMFMPFLGVILAKVRISEMGWKPDITRNWKYILFAWLIPTVFTLAGGFLYFLVFSSDFDASDATLKESFPTLYKKEDVSFSSFFMEQILHSLSPFALFGSVILGLGEEVGWRGFLYPQLKSYFGRTRGVLIGGVIWGAWHFLAMLLEGFEYGTDYIGAPLLGLPVFCIFTVSTGILADYVYEKSESIWLPALFHGAVNSSVCMSLMCKSPFSRRAIFGPEPMGIISVIPVVCIAGVILYRSERYEKGCA